MSAMRAAFLSARDGGGGVGVMGISAPRERKVRSIAFVLGFVVPQSSLSSASVGGCPRLSVSCLALAQRESSRELGIVLICIADHVFR